jgi:hypothetical protein
MAEDLVDYNAVSGIPRKRIRAILDKLTALKAQQEDAELQTKGLRAELGEILQAKNLRGLRVDDLSVTVQTRTNRSISRDLLVQLGVPTKTIDKATAVTVSSPFVVVHFPRE